MTKIIIETKKYQINLIINAKISDKELFEVQNSIEEIEKDDKNMTQEEITKEIIKKVNEVLKNEKNLKKELVKNEIEEIEKRVKNMTKQEIIDYEFIYPSFQNVGSVKNYLASLEDIKDKKEEIYQNQRTLFKLNQPEKQQFIKINKNIILNKENIKCIKKALIKYCDNLGFVETNKLHLLESLIYYKQQELVQKKTKELIQFFETSNLKNQN